MFKPGTFRSRELDRAAAARSRRRGFNRWDSRLQECHAGGSAVHLCRHKREKPDESAARSKQLEVVVSRCFRDVFKYAAGVDYRVIDSKEYPLWLSFRAGRNRTMDSGKEQTAALLTLKFRKGSSLPELPDR